MVTKTYVRLDDGGTYRVGGTRTRLDTIVYEYLQSGNAESVARAFPQIGLENLFGALAFYLANRQEVDEYLKRRESEAEKARAEIEARPVPPVVARLRALKTAKQNQP
jgi:uncharacterized protein (DUF433 family)